MCASYQVEVDLIDSGDFPQNPPAEIMLQMSLKIAFVGAEIVIGHQVKNIGIIRRSAHPRLVSVEVFVINKRDSIAICECSPF